MREKRGLCYTIFAQAGAYSDTGMTTIYAGTSDAQSELANITIDELKRAADTLSQAELDRARAQMKAGLLMGLESASNRAERLARMVQIWGKVPNLEETVARIDAVNWTNCAPTRNRSQAVPRWQPPYGPIAAAPIYPHLRRDEQHNVFL